MIKRFKCGDSYCTKDELTCNKYHELLYKSPEYMIQIDTCPQYIINNLCLNTGNKCLKSFVIGNRVWKTYEKVACPCRGKYKFECSSSNYCSKDKETCHEFQKFNLTLLNFMDQIKNCRD